MAKKGRLSPPVPITKITNMRGSVEVIKVENQKPLSTHFTNPCLEILPTFHEKIQFETSKSPVPIKLC